MKKVILIVVAALAVVVLVIALTSKDQDIADGDHPLQLGNQSKSTARISTVAATSPRKSAGPIARVKPTIEVDDEDDLPPAEKALLDKIEQAMEAEKLDAVTACVKEARSCPNADIRSALVDALGFFGEKALPELSLFLSDANEDVRDNARNEWSTAVSEIEDERKKLDAVEMVMGIVDDEDFLEDISSEYIGVDEKLAVESLVRVIKGEGTASGVAKAKETYEFVTGDEWAGESEAARWLAEEYTPSNDD